MARRLLGKRKIEAHNQFSKTRVNPRPIGRGYKRETRSVSSQVWPDFVHILSAFQSLHHLRYRQNRSATRAQLLNHKAIEQFSSVLGGKDQMNNQLGDAVTFSKVI